MQVIIKRAEECQPALKKTSRSQNAITSIKKFLLFYLHTNEFKQKGTHLATALMWNAGGGGEPWSLASSGSVQGHHFARVSTHGERGQPQSRLHTL